MIRDEYRALDTLLPDSANFNLHPAERVAVLASQILAVGFTAPFLVAEDGTICAGHRRRLALLKLRADNHAEPDGVQPGWMVPCRVGSWDALQRLKVLVGDNLDPAAITYDDQRLADLLSTLAQQGELEGSGYDDARLDELIAALAPDEGTEGDGSPGTRSTLAERFGVPPFSVLDARQGYWQERKRSWLALGIQSELGRGGGY